MRHCQRQKSALTGRRLFAERLTWMQILAGVVTAAGVVMAAVGFCQKNPAVDAHDVRHALEGNLCRCTGYQNIVLAVQQGAAAMKA